jgi:hypothetical protein
LCYVTDPKAFWRSLWILLAGDLECLLDFLVRIE